MKGSRVPDIANRENLKRSLVGHIPHASTFVPPGVKGSFLLDDTQLERQILLLTDWYVDELFSWLGDRAVSFGVSRLVVDPERFIDDAREMMASKGMGVIYTKTSDGKDLRNPLQETGRKDLLKNFYWPHTRLMETMVQSCLDENDLCLVLDCHSFASRPLPFETRQEANRPEICIGTDDFHTPSVLLKSIETFFQSLGWRVSTNNPYSGTYVPLPFFHTDRRVLSVMIEVRRDLYMDESTGLKAESFATVKNYLSELEDLLVGPRTSWQGTGKTR
jgi:N-formylglutamate deformylase